MAFYYKKDKTQNFNGKTTSVYSKTHVAFVDPNTMREH